MGHDPSPPSPEVTLHPADIVPPDLPPPPPPSDVPAQFKPSPSPAPAVNCVINPVLLVESESMQQVLWTTRQALPTSCQSPPPTQPSLTTTSLYANASSTLPSLSITCFIPPMQGIALPKIVGTKLPSLRQLKGRMCRIVLMLPKTVRIKLLSLRWSRVMRCGVVLMAMSL